MTEEHKKREKGLLRLLGRDELIPIKEVDAALLLTSNESITLTGVIIHHAPKLSWTNRIRRLFP